MQRVVLNTKDLVHRLYKEVHPVPFDELMVSIFWIIENLETVDNRLTQLLESLTKEWGSQELGDMANYRLVLEQVCTNFIDRCQQYQLYNQYGALQYTYERLLCDDVVMATVPFPLADPKTQGWLP